MIETGKIAGFKAEDFFDENTLYDISPEISSRTAVFPGDLAFRRDVHLDFKKGNHLLLSSIETTLHIGAHADAPNHYHAEGEGIAAVGLKPYLGACQVISVNTPRGERIQPEHLEGRIVLAPRVLFKTDSFSDPNRWNSDFNSLSPELIHELADRGVILVGVDTPSIDPEDSKILESHRAVYQRRLAVLEGVVLERVPDGLYTLIALPLKLKDADAGPVRAVLVRRFLG
jgi:arylformamidase